VGQKTTPFYKFVTTVYDIRKAFCVYNKMYSFSAGVRLVAKFKYCLHSGLTFLAHPVFVVIAVYSYIVIEG